MFCSSHTRLIALVAALFAGGILAGPIAAQNSNPTSQGQTSVHLHWGQRPGVSRYRLQLARDRGFADIVFDRVVPDLEIEINDLDPGTYFWRIAPLTSSLGEFSSVGAIEVAPAISRAQPSPQPSVSPANLRTSSVVAGGGWRAAIGSINQTIAAHLRTPTRTDLLALNADGVVYALDAASGVALWTVRTSDVPTPRQTSARILLAIPNRQRLDNVVVINGSSAREIEGATGRELWRSTLPAPASAATVISDRSGSQIVIVDNSKQRLLMLREATGELATQMKLSARVVGAPVALSGEGNRAFALSFDNGDLQIRDGAGTLIHAVNVSSPATTAPLFVKGRRGDLLLIGTREGLNALTADELRPLGRVSIPDDAPRGTMVAQDLDGDAVAEIILTTARRHLLVVNSTDGKIVWSVPAADYGDSFAFADVDGDQNLDVFVEAPQRFALALSGRDGKVIWTGDPEGTQATNHANALESRGLVSVPSTSGVLLIGRDASQSGLRAMTFFKAAVRPTSP